MNIQQTRANKVVDMKLGKEVTNTNDLLNMTPENDFYEMNANPDWCIGTCEGGTKLI